MFKGEKFFKWCGIDAKGKRVRGVICAKHLAQTQAELDAIGIKPIFVREQNFFKSFARSKKVARKQIFAFSQQLAKLYNAGIPLATAFDIIKNNCADKAAQDLFSDIKNAIEQGNSFCSILQRYPQYFDALFCNSIQAGEKSGTLDIMLSYLADHYEKTIEQRRKIKKILFYPALVTIFTILITWGLLIFVIPQFQSMFASFGAVLPLYTQIIMNLALFLKANSGSIFCSLGLMIGLTFWAHKNVKQFAEILAYLVVHLPYFGRIAKKAIISRVTRTLSITIKAGLPIYDAVNTVAKIVENPIYKKALSEMGRQIIKGQSLHYAMAKVQLFSPQVMQLVAIGEESGNLDEMLAKIAIYHEEEVNYLSDNFQSLLEPIIMMILGVIVGGLIIGMYLPIFQLGKII